MLNLSSYLKGRVRTRVCCRLGGELYAVKDCTSGIHSDEDFHLSFTSAVGIPATNKYAHASNEGVSPSDQSQIRGISPDSRDAQVSRQQSPLEKPGGGGWLFSEQQQRLGRFKPAMASAHAEGFEVRTFIGVLPRSSVPMTQPHP